MRTELVILLAGAVVAAFVNLVWETLDYGFPDDLAKPEDDKALVGAESTDIVWFAHLTDLHISKFYSPNRTTQLLHLFLHFKQVPKYNGYIHIQQHTAIQLHQQYGFIPIDFFVLYHNASRLLCSVLSLSRPNQ